MPMAQHRQVGYNSCSKYESFLAYDIDGDEVVFMKDAWRTSGYGARKSEKEIYDLLKARGVPYIHKVLFAGDVTGIKAAHRKQLIGHTMPPTAAARSGTPHYRLMQRVAIPLAAALHSKDFVLALYDAAFSKCRGSLRNVSNLPKDSRPHECARLCQDTSLRRQLEQHDDRPYQWKRHPK